MPIVTVTYTITDIRQTVSGYEVSFTMEDASGQESTSITFQPPITIQAAKATIEARCEQFAKRDVWQQSIQQYVGQQFTVDVDTDA